MIKRLLTLIACLFFFSAQAEASGLLVGSGLTVAGESCPGDQTLWINLGSTADFWSVSTGTTTGYWGQGGFDPGANKTICQADINVKTIAGSGGTYQIEIAPMSGTALGATPAGCTSDSQAINTTGVKSLVGLNCPLTNGTTYGITITRTGHTIDAVNYIVIYTNNASDGSSGDLRRWYHDDRTQSADLTPADFGLVLYAIDTP